ncbi:MAG: hypothetical protein WC833_11505 [Bacteroidales bacterium]|jgi:RNA recognition motif-containing protein
MAAVTADNFFLKEFRKFSCLRFFNIFVLLIKHLLNFTIVPMNIFVSSLSFRAKKEDLAELFTPYGEVISARIIINRDTRRSKGYGFVEMPNDNEGIAAITALNGAEHMGRTINVAQANERPAREE